MASLKVQVAYGGGTSRNSAAHWRPVGKRPIGAGQCVLRGKWTLLLAPFSFGSFSFGRAKENEHGLSHLNYSLRGSHYPEHLKNVS